MKDKILEINNRLSENDIDFKQARKELCELFGVKYKPKITGKAIVKSRNKNKWIYEGYELSIVGLYMIYQNGSGGDIYPDGTREFKLSLEGTSFVESQGYTYTVIPETDLVILELDEE